MAAKQSSRFLSEDLVYRRSRDGRYQVGIVLKAASETDSEDEDDVVDKLPTGTVRVVWYPSGRHEDLFEDKISLLDRSLLPGDVVRMSNRSLSEQLGYVQNTSSKITVKILGTNQVIEDVSPQELQDCRPLSTNVLCVFDNWVGFVVDVQYDILMSTQDGGSLMMDQLDFEFMLERELEEEKHSHFEKNAYVGQVIVVRKKYLRHINVRKKSKITETIEDPDEPGSLEVLLTIQEVRTGRAEVRWIMKATAEDVALETPPRDIVCPDMLKKFTQIDCFAKNAYCTGDRAYFTIKESDVLTPFDDWQYQVKETDSESETTTAEPSLASSSGVKSMTNRRRKKITVPVNKIRNMRLKPSKKLKGPTVNTSPGTRVAVEIVVTETTSTVFWQDGSVGEGIPSLSLHPVIHVDNHEYFPGDFVVENKQEMFFTYGVVQTVDHAARTVTVLWMEEPVSSWCHPVEKETEAVSVYDLKDHPDFQFRPGSCVVRLTDGEKEMVPSKCVGQVLKLTVSGKLECMWADGSVELVYPQCLLFIGDYDDDDLFAESDMESDFGSQESLDETNVMSQREKLCLLLAAVNDLEHWLTSNDTVNSKNQSQSLKMVMKLCKAVKDTRMQSTVVELKHLQQLIDNSQAPSSTPLWSKLTARLSEMMSKTVNGSASTPAGSSTSSAVMSVTSTPQLASQSSKTDSPVSKRTSLGLETLRKIKTQLFPLCGSESTKIPDASPVKDTEASGDVVEEPKTLPSPSAESQVKVMESVSNSHRFKLSVMRPNRIKEFMARVRHEIKILSSSLPCDIFVKTFEDRLDLMSIMIKGPEKTPYEDGLFLFDVQLPSDYPQVPPVVNYLSFCRDRLNPNLYECGKVCVSLLGTWTGKGSEVWNAHSSNLLQLLVSIQGLILVPEPYFNEAGYMNQRGTLEGLENSRLYNEMAVVKLVQSMNQMLSNPPEAFAQEIKDHIKVTSAAFTSRLQEWIRVSEDYSQSPNPEKKKVLSSMTNFPLLPASKGFCLSLKKALADFERTLILKF